MRSTAIIRSLEIDNKSGKSQGILKWKMSGNPGIVHRSYFAPAYYTVSLAL